MRYQFIYTNKFKKHFAKLNLSEKNQVKNKLEIFIDNPSDPSLRSKKIQGIKGVFESSVNMDIRIIWYYEKEEIIILLDIGHHDILDKL